MSGPVYFYLPPNFNAADVLPAELRRYSACADYLVHLIVRGRVLRHDDGTGWVPLKIAYLREVIPDRVERRIRMALIDSRVIECDGHFIKGEKSMNYRLTSQYRVSAHQVECGNARIAAKVARVRGTMFRRDTRLPVHKHLRKWLGELHIDSSAAKGIVLSTPRLAENADIHFTTIEMIGDGHVEFSHCRQGRVHSIVTRTARELRAALRIKGQKLVNIDIVNTQPLLLSHLTTHHTHPHPEGDRTSNTMSNSENYLRKYNMLMDLQSAKCAQGDDIIRFADLCEDGAIYEYLSSRAGLVALSRDEIKVKFYTDILFGRSQYVTDFTRLFAAEFPTVMAVIRSAKKRDYCDLARTLQKIESNLMIHRVCRRLLLEHPNVPVITIHDSIMTTPGNVELVRGVMAEEFGRVGLHPKFKLESGCGAMAQAA